MARKVPERPGKPVRHAYSGSTVRATWRLGFGCSSIGLVGVIVAAGVHSKVQWYCAAPYI